MSRIESDSLGEMELDDDVYYGIQTARALENFPVSGIKESPEFIRVYVLIKKAAAITNADLGVLDKNLAEAIIKAAEEAETGKFNDHFVVDVFQAGAGTSFNMNANEVLANRALEILGKQKGDYETLSPNDHVNMAQSSNDTFPTASHMAVIFTADRLIEIITNFKSALNQKAEEFKEIPKSGRTHLVDATPVTLGAEFNAYATSMNRSIERLKQRRDDLLELPLGGTAVGTGANTHPEYRKNVIKKLSELCSVNFVEPKESFEALQSRAQLAAFSSALKELALELIRIANDLRLLNSGPTTGIAEIKLPAVQPGSSIMPGKTNPVMAECLDMIGFQIIGNDTAVALAASAGQLELNVMTPVMTYNILHSMDLLINYLPTFQKRCIEGIEADFERCEATLEKNPALTTLLSPKIGYLKAAEIAKEAQKRNISVKELALEKQLITDEEAEEIFDKRKLTKSIYD